MPADDDHETDTIGVKSAGDNDHTDKGKGASQREAQDTPNTVPVKANTTKGVAIEHKSEQKIGPEIPKIKDSSATVSSDENAQIGYGQNTATSAQVVGEVTPAKVEDPEEKAQAEPQASQSGIHGRTEDLKDADTLKDDAEKAGQTGFKDVQDEKAQLDRQFQDEDAEKKDELDKMKSAEPQGQPTEPQGQSDAAQPKQPMSSWGRNAAADAMGIASSLAGMGTTALDYFNRMLKLTFSGGMSPGSIGDQIGTTMDAAGKTLDDLVDGVSDRFGVDIEKLKKDPNAVGTYMGKKALKEDEIAREASQSAQEACNTALKDALGEGFANLSPEQLENAMKNMTGVQLKRYGESLMNSLEDDKGYQDLVARFNVWQAENPGESPRKFPMSEVEKTKMAAYYQLLAPYKQHLKESDQRYRARAKAYRDLKAKIPEAKRQGKEAYAKLIHDFRENYYQNLADDKDRMVIDVLGGVDKVHIDNKGNLSMSDLRRARDVLEARGLAEARQRVQNNVSDPEDQKLVDTWEYLNDMINRENSARRDLREAGKEQEREEFRRTNSPMIVGLHEMYGNNYQNKVDPNTGLPMTGEGRLYVKNYCDSILNDPSATPEQKAQAMLTKGMMDGYTQYWNTLKVAENKLQSYPAGSPEYAGLNDRIDKLKGDIKWLSGRYPIDKLAEPGDPDRLADFETDMQSLSSEIASLNDDYALTREVQQRKAAEEREAQRAIREADRYWKDMAAFGARDREQQEKARNRAWASNAREMDKDITQQEREGRAAGAEAQRYYEQQAKDQAVKERQDRYDRGSLYDREIIGKKLDGKEGTPEWDRAHEGEYGMPNRSIRSRMLKQADEYLRTYPEGSPEHNMASRTKGIIEGYELIRNARRAVDKYSQRYPLGGDNVDRKKATLSEMERLYSEFKQNNPLSGDAAFSEYDGQPLTMLNNIYVNKILGASTKKSASTDAVVSDAAFAKAKVDFSSPEGQKLAEEFKENPPENPGADNFEAWAIKNKKRRTIDNEKKFDMLRKRWKLYQDWLADQNSTPATAPASKEKPKEAELSADELNRKIAETEKRIEALKGQGRDMDSLVEMGRLKEDLKGYRRQLEVLSKPKPAPKKKVVSTVTPKKNKAAPKTSAPVSTVKPEKKDEGRELIKRAIGRMPSNNIKRYIYKQFQEACDIEDRAKKGVHIGIGDLRYDDLIDVKRYIMSNEGQGMPEADVKRVKEALRTNGDLRKYSRLITDVMKATGVYDKPKLNAPGRDSEGNKIKSWAVRDNRDRQIEMFGQEAADGKDLAKVELAKILKTKYGIKTLRAGDMGSDEQYFITLDNLDRARFDLPSGRHQKLLNDARNKLIYQYTARKLASMPATDTKGNPLRKKSLAQRKQEIQGILHDLQDMVLTDSEMPKDMWTKVTQVSVGNNKAGTREDRAIREDIGQKGSRVKQEQDTLKGDLSLAGFNEEQGKMWADYLRKYPYNEHVFDDNFKTDIWNLIKENKGLDELPAPKKKDISSQQLPVTEQKPAAEPVAPEAPAEETESLDDDSDQSTESKSRTGYFNDDDFNIF